MTDISLRYGQSQITAAIPDTILVDHILPPTHPTPPSIDSLVREAIANPVGAADLAGISSGDKVAIAVNDKTRPVRHDLVLPPLLEALAAHGVKDEQICFYIATGTHLPMQPAEFELVLPENLLTRYQVVSHNCDDMDNLECLGKTGMGTPIWVNRPYYTSDYKITIGNIEPHHFMGFSGGVKSVAIGLTGRETINTNHSMLLNPECAVGRYENNPMRMDVEEIGERIGVHYAINLLPGKNKQIATVIAGQPRKVMELGVPLSRALSQVKVDHRYDLVIASAGGYPKDINLYQAQKAITHASLITRDGGVVILSAECVEGHGSTGFVDFLRDISTVDQVFKKFKQTGFSVGPHKAFQIARDAARIKIILVSSLEDELVQKFFLQPASSLQSAVDQAMAWLPDSSSIAVLPFATNTIPWLD